MAVKQFFNEAAERVTDYNPAILRMTDAKFDLLVSVHFVESLILSY
jgi:hypothetical protein